MSHRILELNHVKTTFKLIGGQNINPVDDLSLFLNKGDTVGLVGESGCGKSMTALSILRLVPPPGKITQGEILFNGENILKWSPKKLSGLRGNQIATVFQDPMTYLNPVLTIDNQISEALRLHTGASKTEIHGHVLTALSQVGIASPERVAKSYPFELSGGMRQRALIAMAISCEPAILIADEPTTALDVTVQAQIINLLKQLVKRNNISILLITHDMGIVADICDKVYVMYAGQIVESGSVDDIFYHAAHPYTRALLDSVLTIHECKQKPINTIKGLVPDFLNLPKGCRFMPRCEYASEDCLFSPDLYRVSGNHFSRCVMCKV